MTKKEYRTKVNYILGYYLRADEYASVMAELDELDQIDKVTSPDLAIEEVLHITTNEQ